MNKIIANLENWIPFSFKNQLIVGPLTNVRKLVIKFIRTNGSVNTPCCGNPNGLRPKEDLLVLSVKHLWWNKGFQTFLKHSHYLACRRLGVMQMKGTCFLLVRTNQDFPGTPRQRTSTHFFLLHKGNKLFPSEWVCTSWIQKALLCPWISSGLCLPAASSGFPLLNVPKWNSEMLLPTSSQRHISFNESCTQTHSNILGVFSSKLGRGCIATNAMLPAASAVWYSFSEKAARPAQCTALRTKAGVWGSYRVGGKSG